MIDPIFNILTFRKLESVNEFCRENLSFTVNTSPTQPGRWSTLQRKYQEEPLEDWHPDNGITDSTNIFGAQNGKTTIVKGGMAYTIARNPGPGLMVMPDNNLVKSFSNTRWMPFCRENPVLEAELPANLDHFTISEQQFRRAIWTFVGSHSASALSSRPKQFVVQDELEKFKSADKDEASASKLADQRTKEFGDSAFRYKATTPGAEDGEAWKYYLAGDQRDFLIECPHCREGIKLEHIPLDRDKNLKGIPLDPNNSTLGWDPKALTLDGLWDKTKVETSAFYRCQHCFTPIFDHQKPSMCLSGEWVAKNLSASKKVRSRHLGSLYSPNVTFGRQLLAYFAGKEELSLQDYYNGWEAKPWSETVTVIGDRAVEECRINYDFGTIPSEFAGRIDRLMIACDPGELQTYWTVTGHCDRTLDCWLIDAGTVLGGKAETGKKGFGDLWDVAGRKWTIGATGEARGLDGVGWIDSGEWTEAVYDFCWQSGGFFWPTKGSDAKYGTIATSPIKTHPGLTLLTYVDYAAKNDLYEERIGLKNGARLYLPKDCPEAVLKGLSGQEKLLDGWKKIRWDHYGDCVKIVLRGHRALLVGR